MDPGFRLPLIQQLCSRKTWLIGCLGLFCLVGGNLFGQNLQEIIPIHSAAYRWLDDILLEAGRVPTSNVRPYTKAQFLLAMGLVDKQQLTDQGVAAYNKLREILEPKSLYTEKGLFNFSAGISGGLESYFKTDSQHSERFKGYGNRIPLLAIPFSLDFMDVLSLAADFDAQEEYFAVNEDSPGFDAFNIPGNLGWLDINQPRFTNASLGTDHFNISIGRNQLTVGPGVYSKLLISDNADYLEYLSLKTFWDVFTFSVLVVNMNPVLLTGESLRADETPIKNYFMHRTEVSLFDQRLNIALAEGYMIGGADPELKDFNPLMVFHDYFDWSHASSIFSAEFSLNPWKYFNVYGQFIFNQIQTAYELDTYGATDMPNARGFLAGLQYRMPLGDGYIGAVGEFWYTDPWLYIRESPLTSYAWRNVIVSNIRGKGAAMTISEPLGFKYGPDTMAFNVGVSYDWQDLIHAQLDAAYVMKGEQTIDSYAALHMGDAAVKMKTPTGISENTLSFILSAAVTPFEWIEIDGSLATYFIENTAHVSGVRSTDVQGSLGVQFFLGRKPYERR